MTFRLEDCNEYSSLNFNNVSLGLFSEKHTTQRYNFSSDGTHSTGTVVEDLFEKSMQTVPLIPTGPTVSLSDDRYKQKPMRLPTSTIYVATIRLVHISLHSLLTASSVSSVSVLCLRCASQVL